MTHEELLAVYPEAIRYVSPWGKRKAEANKERWEAAMQAAALKEQQ